LNAGAAPRLAQKKRKRVTPVRHPKLARRNNCSQWRSQRFDRALGESRSGCPGAAPQGKSCGARFRFTEGAAGAPGQCVAPNGAESRPHPIQRAEQGRARRDQHQRRIRLLTERRRKSWRLREIDDATGAERQSEDVAERTGPPDFASLRRRKH